MRRAAPWGLLIAVFGAVLVAAFVGASGRMAPQGVHPQSRMSPSRVPSVIGMDRSSAKRIAFQWGAPALSVGYEDSRASAGTVIYQTPPAGIQRIPYDTTFTMVVAIHYRTTADVPVASCSSAIPVGTGRAKPKITRTTYPPAKTASVNIGRASARIFRVYATKALVAPSGWTCSGFVAVDGGNFFTAVPPGETPPNVNLGLTWKWPATSRVAVLGEPACSSCVWGMTCGLFPSEKYGNPGAQCPSIPPPEETDRRFGKYVVDFTDPPGVAGTGRPSGGDEPAIGAVVLKHWSSAMVTCVLPTEMSNVCRAAIHAFTTYELALPDTGLAMVSREKS